MSLTRAVPAASVALARSWRAGCLAAPPERQPLRLGLPRAPILRVSWSSGAEDARQLQRGLGGHCPAQLLAPGSGPNVVPAGVLEHEGIRLGGRSVLVAYWCHE